MTLLYIYIHETSGSLFRYDSLQKKWLEDTDLADMWVGERWVDEITEQEALDGIVVRENCAANSN